jgi:queuosine precursor transporter
MTTRMLRFEPVNVIVMVSVAYVAAQLLSDIASLKIAYVAGLSIDAGTLVYPLTFTLRDLVHKTAGIQTARLLILAAAAINIVMALLFQLAAALPADMSVGPQLEFALVLAPVWRIVIASIVAEVVSEFVDSEVYQRWRNRFAARHQWGRVLASNAVSVPLDSALFCVLAFAGTLPPEVVVSIFVSNMLVKFALTLVTLPSIYLVREGS